MTRLVTIAVLGGGLLALGATTRIADVRLETNSRPREVHTTDQAARPLAPLRFVAHLVDSSLAGGYQVIVADLNLDGKPDLIGLASGMRDLRWYESPNWTPHLLVGGLDAPINADVADLDGDGIPEIALAHGFSTVHAQSVGTASILSHDGDPRRPWTSREIDRLPTSHRLRFADVDGSGAPVLVNFPLIGAGAVAPDYRERVPLVMYRPGTWTREPITNDLSGVMHGILVARWGDEAQASVLSAGFEGVDRMRLNGGQWSRERVVPGDTAAWPRSGASEIAVGRAGRERFLATIEPWHGHQVVVYRRRNDRWERQVIDARLEDAHTLVVGDFDGDGTDELVVGERKGRKSAYVYRLTDAKANAWTRETLDDGRMAAAGCAVADLNGDKRPDVVCIEKARLTWYENRP